MHTENFNPSENNNTENNNATTQENLKQTQANLNIETNVGTTTENDVLLNGGTEKPQKTASISALGITSLVIGVLAALTSIIPIVNNASPFIAIVGVAFLIPAFIMVKKGKRRGKGIVITALVLNVVAIIVTLVMQAACSAAFDSATSGEAVKTVTTEQGETSKSTSQDKENLPLGTAINLKNGLSVTVVSVEGGLSNYDGSAVSKVTVTYTNNGDDEESFNAYDWKVEDAQGAQTSQTFYSKGDSSANLSSGKLSKGGTKTGVIYFKAPFTKVVYSSSLISDSSAKWKVS